MIYCYCPRCKKETHDYIRKGAKEFRTVSCMNCGVKFRVNIHDFVDLESDLPFDVFYEYDNASGQFYCKGCGMNAMLKTHSKRCRFYHVKVKGRPE